MYVSRTSVDIFLVKKKLFMIDYSYPYYYKGQIVKCFIPKFKIIYIAITI